MKLRWLVLLGALVLGPAATAGAQVSVQVGDPGKGDAPTTPVQILVLLLVLAVLPGIVFAVTAFPRIIITLSFLRSAMGTPSIPPNQVLIGLALFLTLFVMSPTLNAVKKTSLDPYLDKKISFQTAVERGQEPVRRFMFRQTRQGDLALFMKLADKPQPRTRADVPTLVLIPAFMISELKTAFQIGLMLYLPFLIIDMVVASTLLSLGMMMLPPPLISLPFKILLFVLVDGWALLVAALVGSFNT